MSRRLQSAAFAALPDADPVSALDALELLEYAQTGVLVVQDGLIAYANAAAIALLGWNAGPRLQGQPYEVTTAPVDRERAHRVFARRLAGRPGQPGSIRCLRRDRSEFDARVCASRIEFRCRPAVLVTLFDISELQQALHRAQWNAGMLARTEALCRSGSFEVFLPQGRVVPSQGLRTLIGDDAENGAEGQLDALAWIPLDERAYVAAIWRNAAPGEPFEFQHRICGSDGRRLIVLHRGLVDAEPGPLRRGVALLQDITAQREAEMRALELATHDEVTGLRNRPALLDHLDAALHHARWGAGSVTVFAIEIPRIADIKAKMGFGAGDTLAMALAARLRESTGEGELIAQLSDTEFALLIESRSAVDAAAMLRRGRALVAVLERPVLLGATDVFPRCVVGISAFPGDAELPAGLLECAQKARLNATELISVVQFAPESNRRALREMEVESALRQALARGELALHYQPQVDLADGRIVGAEALLRWDSPQLGAVSPGEFIPVAERCGLIGTVGDWVLQRSCEQISAWRHAGLPPLRIGINLSASQLQRPDLAQHIQAVLIATGADPSSLGVELTEGTAMVDVTHAAAVLRDIKAIGIEISLDDFGTGFSSLSCLRSLPIDVVKVDRAFVHDITAAPEDVSVTRAIITMAHGLQMRVLAEGVETEGQLSLLAANSCDLIQGFYFSKAVPADAFAAMVREARRLPERFVTRVRRTRTLLLVDDEENILASLKRLLRRDGYHIVTATGGAEGLQRMAETEVDVIVSDQRMPGMTGVEMLRRAKELYPSTIRMVLSGYTELQSIIDAVNEGAIYRFLTKPWDDELLRGHVAEAFRQKDMADENRRLALQVETANLDFAKVNDRLQALLALQREQAALLTSSADGMRSVFESLPAALIGVDPDGLVVLANRRALALLAPQRDLLGCSAADVLPDAVLAALADRSGLPRAVQIDGTRHMVLPGTLSGRDGELGRLLMFAPPLNRETN